MFGWEFPPNITGGLGTACYGLSEALVSMGHKITFVMPNNSVKGDANESFVRIIDASDIEISHCKKIEDELFQKMDFIRVDSNILPYVSPEDFRTMEMQLKKCSDADDLWHKRYTFGGGYGIDLMEQVAKYAVVASQIAQQMRGEFDVIHCHDWLTYLAGIEAKKILGINLIVHVHATQFDRSSEDNKGAIYAIEKEGMNKADRIVAVSEHTKRMIVEYYGINPSKIEVVYNGVTDDWSDVQEDKKTYNTKVVTFLGRVTYQKGPEYFVDMAKRLLDYNSNIRFIIGGNGDRLSAIKKKVNELKMDDKFLFTGFLDKKKVQDVFSISDVYVMPSVSEPFGISPLEAMLCNVPVVISKQSGVAEVIKNAIKVDYWDIDAMANAVYGILSYPELYKYMVTQGKEEAKSVKWSSAAQRLTSLYRKLGK